ncbi:PapD-like protein [Umbelopsis sp. AD052]|nr:PapD-like protein [Umbelopsis sp. AD052]
MVEMDDRDGASYLNVGADISGEAWTSANPPYNTDNMSIELNPSNQLAFQRPLTRTVTETLTLNNPNAEPAIFKIKTTAPKAYCVRPNSGRVDPGSSVTVQVLLQPMAQEPPEDHKCKDKFLVQSAILPSSLAHLPPADIMSEINSSDPSRIHQAKLKCVYLPATHDAAPVQATQPAEEQIIPVQNMASTEQVKRQSSIVVNSDEEEAYQNALKPQEQVVPEQLGSPVTPPMVSPPSFDHEDTPEQLAPVPIAEKAPVDSLKVDPTPPVPVLPPVQASNTNLDEVKRYENENKELRNNLQSANESILSMQKNIDSLKRELSAAQASVITLRKNGTSSTAAATGSGRKLASTVKPEDAVHQHLASLQVASPTEGYPPQVVAIIAFVVFLFTWLFF